MSRTRVAESTRPNPFLRDFRGSIPAQHRVRRGNAEFSRVSRVLATHPKVHRVNVSSLLLTLYIADRTDA